MKRLSILLLLVSTLCACRNKELSLEDPCYTTGWDVQVRVNWENPDDARNMRMSLFSQNDLPHLDRENVDVSGLKTIKLPVGSHYMPVIYDYNAKNIYFRNESDYDLVEAYSNSSSRATYNSRAVPVAGEGTVSEPGNFHYHAHNADVEGAFRITQIPAADQQLTIDFYPMDVMRKFTFCIRNVLGAKNISESRGAVSGMAASIFLATGEMNPVRSTILFENASASDDNIGEITGSFSTFGPLTPYSNRFTIEVMSGSGQYHTAYWDVSDQIEESTNDHDAKIQRDGYDILLVNDPNTDIPPIVTPEDPDYDSGFEIGVGEWDDVIIYL